MVILNHIKEPGCLGHGELAEKFATQFVTKRPSYLSSKVGPPTMPQSKSWRFLWWHVGLQCTLMSYQVLCEKEDNNNKIQIDNNYVDTLGSSDVPVPVPA